MASNGHHRPRNRTLILAAAIAFILSAVFLTYMRLDPLPLTMSSPHDVDNEAMATGKSKHDKGHQTYPQISTLPASHLPTKTRRLMIIGDVHGHVKSLEALLRKAEFSASRGDTVVFAGDMVNKGPDSAGVVELAMRIGAFGVRGNHEDRVLRAWEYLEAKKRAKGEGVDSNSNSDDDDEEEDESEEIQNSGSGEGSEEEEDSPSTSYGKKRKEKKHRKNKGKKDKKNKKKKKGHKHKPHKIDIVTAKSLKPEHRAWLSRLPLILRIGDLGPRYGEVLVVHAGLVPGVPLESQDPEAVMTMRTILLPSLSDASHLFDPSHTENDNQRPFTTTTTTTTDEIEVSKNKHHPPKMIPSASRKGIPWAEIWTSYQQAYFSPPSLPSSPSSPSPPSSQLLLPVRPATVVYGHDAKAGLKMRKYAFGVDSGCGNGERLTGVVFEQSVHDNEEIRGEEGRGEEDENENGKDTDDNGNGNDREGEEGDEQSTGHKARIRHRLVSVSCAEEH
ncbi:Metallo-dependent phosphatase-like protein [Xylaria flabelliformis]|nr:Metallo-dependent phosphatase-like protein [Xylaria flabelliformis]